MEQHSNDNSSSFWKNNSRAVPGRPSPKKEVKHGGFRSGRGGHHSTFQDFQESVSDAWDMGDDEFCIISETKISKRVSDAAALNVIKTHKSYINNSNHRNQEYFQKSSASNYYNNSTTTNSHTINSNESSNNAPPPSSTTASPTSSVATTNNSNSANIASARERIEIEPNLNVNCADVDCDVVTSDSRPKYRQFHAYPGRPQLLKFSSNHQMSKDIENETKLEKFSTLLDAELLNLIELKKLSWSGIPRKMRAITWRLLSGYLPTSLERRNTVLERKRLDYQKLVDQYFHIDSRDEAQQDTFRQIHIDVPRMNPHVPLFQQTRVQEMFERILFIWAIRHPASGYVQGINDLVTPFFIVFLQEALNSDRELETFKMEELDDEKCKIIEADSFWCLSKFLDCIQDNYIFAQLGIQEKVNQLKELIQRIDVTLHKHLQHHGVDYLQFSFRWMNNLLTRELPLHCTIRLWDTYLAESDGFALFQLYVCASFLLYWRDQLLQERDFQGLMLLLQNLPTQNWDDSHIGLLVAEAFKLKFTYADAPKHLEGKS